MKKLITICAAAALVLAVSGITSGQEEEYWGVHLFQDMEDSEISYGFDAYASFSGTVTTPLSETLSMGWVEEPTLSALTTRFPDGTYTFFDGVDSYLAVLDCPFAGQFPNITSTTFEPGGDLTITWDLWEIDKFNPIIDILIEDSEYYTQIDASSTEHTIPALQLPPLPLFIGVEFKNMTLVDGGGTHGDKIKSAGVEVIPEPATVE